MGRLHKLEADIELDVLPNPSNPHIVSQSSVILNSNQHSPSSTTTEYACDGNNGLNYNNNNPLMINNNLINGGGGGGAVHNGIQHLSYESAYGKEVYFGLKHKELGCGGEAMDDAYLRPPLWEDITSSIQNIDPENAMMLASLPGATQVSHGEPPTCPYPAQINNSPVPLPSHPTSGRRLSWSGETGGQRRSFDGAVVVTSAQSIGNQDGEERDPNFVLD